MKGDRPEAIPHQIQGSVVTHIDVIGSEEVRAKVSGERGCHDETGNSATGNSEMFLVAHGVKWPSDPAHLPGTHVSPFSLEAVNCGSGRVQRMLGYPLGCRSVVPTADQRKRLQWRRWGCSIPVVSQRAAARRQQLPPRTAP